MSESPVQPPVNDEDDDEALLKQLMEEDNNQEVNDEEPPQKNDELVEEEEEEDESQIPDESSENQQQQDKQQDTDEPKVKLTKLPIGRVKTIVKTDSDVNLINQEAVFLITKATELFIDSLSKESYKYTHQSKKKTVQKRDVESAITNSDALVFLDGM